MGIALLACALTACSDKPAAAWSGYAEGDYVYVAAPLAGRLDGVAVQAGQTVAMGADLFSLDAESEQAAQQEAAARLTGAQATYGGYISFECVWVHPGYGEAPLRAAY